MVYFINPSAFSEADECLRWFQKAKIPYGKNCEVDCSTIPVDMATFDCGTRCEDFCKQAKPKGPCVAKGSWISKIKVGRPTDWLLSSEQSTPWAPAERKSLEDALNKLSDKFPVDGLSGIYKLDRSKNPFARGTPSTYYNHQIVFYETAFDDQYNIETLLVHELGHHLHETDKSLFSKFKNQFEQLDEEDFAKQFELFIVNNKGLKKANPASHKWMQENLKDKYFIKECSPWTF